MSNKYLGLAAVALALTSVCPANAKKVLPPDQATVVQMQTDFWNESDTDEFIQAEQNLDLETMKSLMNSVGIAPAADFPQEVPVSKPPTYYLSNVWSLIYGPNPNDGNTVEWFADWFPECVAATRHRGTPIMVIVKGWHNK